MLDVLFPLSEQFLDMQYRTYVRYFIKQHSFKNRFTIIRGQRGIGKSTAIVQLLRQQNLKDHQRLYVPVDHFLVKNYTLYDIADAFVQQGGRYIGFDEIHKYDNWSQELKSIYDTFPKLHIYASGSSALAIHRGTHDLSRRAVLYTMTGMSFREYLELQYDFNLEPIVFDDILNNHEKASKKIIEILNKRELNVLHLFKEYLQYGFYPYSIEFPDKKDFYLTIEQNLHAVLESDLPAIYPSLSGASVNKMKRMLGFMSTHVPFTVDLKALKEILDISDERTLKQYMKIMDEAGLIMQLHRDDKKMQGLKKADKIYPNNACQLYALSAFQPIEIGTVREVFFLSMIKQEYPVVLPKYGDFLVNQKITFEVGGKNKDFSQIHDVNQSYLALDNIEQGYRNKIPLWLFGFLY